MSNDSDTLQMMVLHKDILSKYDHPPKTPLGGHGPRCYTGCKPIDVLVVETWKNADGERITDQTKIARATIARIQQEIEDGKR